jgi:hypothetical protein
MSGSATLVITVSMTSRIAPSEAASVIAHFRIPAGQQAPGEGREERRVGAVEGAGGRGGGRGTHGRTQERPLGRAGASRLER